MSELADVFFLIRRTGADDDAWEVADQEQVDALAGSPHFEVRRCRPESESARERFVQIQGNVNDMLEALGVGLTLGKHLEDGNQGSKPKLGGVHDALLAAADHLPLRIAAGTLLVPVEKEVLEWLHDHDDEAELLRRFLGLMATEMAANEDKGNRPGWLQMGRKEAIAEVHWHAAKLAVAAKEFDSQGVERSDGGGLDLSVREFAADVANCALMALDCLGLLGVGDDGDFDQ
jgi:hypothetical protein